MRPQRFGATAVRFQDGECREADPSTQRGEVALVNLSRLGIQFCLDPQRLRDSGSAEAEVWFPPASGENEVLPELAPSRTVLLCKSMPGGGLPSFIFRRVHKPKVLSAKVPHGEDLRREDGLKE